MRFAFCVFGFLVAMAPKVFAQNFSEIQPSRSRWSGRDLAIAPYFTVTNTFVDRESGDGTTAPSVFNPASVDAEQWIEAVKKAGAKYVILVAETS